MGETISGEKNDDFETGWAQILGRVVAALARF
jgi:hypothetical protein